MSQGFTSGSRTSGQIIHVVNTQTGAVATGTTTIPNDDTIPQITEGTEFITRAITPSSTSNILRIDAVISAASSTTNRTLIALFQDATANALSASSGGTQTGASQMHQFHMTYYMTAGTTSSTTFRIRIGSVAAATITLNGEASARLLGGVALSMLSVTEIKA